MFNENIVLLEREVETSGPIFFNILFIGPNYKNHRGGIGAVLESYAQCIDGFKFIATYDGRYNILLNIGLFILSIFRIIKKLLSDRSIKIVHIHGASKGSFVRKYLVFLIVKFLFRKKVIYHLHGGRFHLFYENSGSVIRYLIKHLAESVNIFVCLSTYWQNYLITQFNIKNIVILNNPVAVPEKLAWNRFERNEKILNILFLGRVGDRKGVFDLIEVINRHKELWEGKIKLKIGGDGDVDRLLKFIETENLSNIIEYTGWVDGQKKHELLSECDVLVLPSYNEGLPISILEAMSYGKAIVSTKVGGIPEVVKHQENGFLITPGDREGLAEAIKWLVQNLQLTRHMGELSKTYVQPYLIENVLTQLKSIYNHEILG